MPHSTYMLVDYDNAMLREEVAPLDVRANMVLLTTRIRAAVLKHGLPKNISLRLYGGWHFDDGRMTPRAEWLLRLLPDFAQLREGVRTKPDLATSVVAAAGRVLHGTYRNSSGPEQKMVDTMIVADAVYLARRRGTCVAIISDDADVIPGLITAGREKSPSASVVWLRSADRKTHPGDGTVRQSCSIEVLT